MASLSRIRITGGFLGGLDLHFGPALNVIVGPRGAGKTTLLELLRHALALPGDHDERGRAAFLRHALGAGEIIIDLRTSAGAERLVVDAQGGGTRSEETSDMALMLGQNELENIADDPRRRLALIDLRAGISAKSTTEANEKIRSLTHRAHEARTRCDQLRDQLRQKPSLLEDRERLREREAELLSRSAGALTPQREELARFETSLLAAQQAQQDVATLHRLSASVLSAVTPLPEALQAGRQLSPAVAERDEMQRLLWAAEQAVGEVGRLVKRVDELASESIKKLQDDDARIRTAAEPIRSLLEQLEQGLGSVTAESRDLDAQLARLESVERQLHELSALEAGILADRDALHDSLEHDAEALFDTRDRAAKSITRELDHRVQISVRHLADASSFKSVLAAALQGHGLQHNVLAESVAGSVLPLMLLRYVEQRDADALSDATGLSPDRAARVIFALDSADALSAIAGVTLQDAVDFRLQDGAVLKSAGQLSTGQKCAVTMPIVLTDRSRMVILDQPEDHLDNLFLVDRIVTSLVRRSRDGAQSIVATHNPNIPVLGEAVQVAHLVSDGAKGAVDVRGTFDSPSIVHVITSLMEGGRRAFDYRAQFYASHPDDAARPGLQ